MSKQPLILIHGALGNANQMQTLAKAASATYHVYTFQCPYHDGNAVEVTHFTIPYFANALLQFIAQHNIHNPIVMGYSMGGYIALYAQQKKPSMAKIITYGTKFNWSAQATTNELKMLQPQTIIEKVPRFATQLQSLFGNTWQQVVLATAALMNDICKQQYLSDKQQNTILIPVTLLVGNTDNMVTVAETKIAATIFDNATVHQVIGEHPLHKVDVNMLLNFINA
jgi:pimeloyl-ACP methyl ester carboxylesterase